MNEAFIYSTRYPRMGDSYDSHTMSAVDNIIIWFHVSNNMQCCHQLYAADEETVHVHQKGYQSKCRSIILFYIQIIIIKLLCQPFSSTAACNTNLQPLFILYAFLITTFYNNRRMTVYHRLICHMYHDEVEGAAV